MFMAQQYLAIFMLTKINCTKLNSDESSEMILFPEIVPKNMAIIVTPRLEIWCKAQSFPVILKREIRYFENIVDSIFKIYNHPIFNESKFTFSHKQSFLFSNLSLKHNSAL